MVSPAKFNFINPLKQRIFDQTKIRNMKTINSLVLAIIVISISSCGTTSNFSNKRYLNLDKSYKSKDITPENTTSDIKTIIEDEKNELAVVETTDLIADQIGSEAQTFPQNQQEQKAFQLTETNESNES
jgi:hypothetical protein